MFFNKVPRMAKLFALLLWVKSIAVGDIKMKTSSILQVLECWLR